MRAILAIDVQESFRARADEWARVSTPDVARRVQRVVEHGRAAGDVVVWVLHAEPGSGGAFDPANGQVRLQDGLDARDDDVRVTKQVHNAFTDTDLDVTLRRLGVAEVVVTGIRTEQCCETTARIASDLGYRVTFVIDATATHPHDAWDGGVISSSDIQRATASALQGRFAEVTTVDAFVKDRVTD